MTERIWRLILGALILTFLSWDLDLLLWCLIGFMFFEGITNIRMPVMISKLRYGDAYYVAMSKNVHVLPSPRVIHFEAERILRFTMGGALLITSVVYPIWFFPWFVGLMLTMAGLTNICPMLMIIQWVGFTCDVSGIKKSGSESSEASEVINSESQ